MLKWKVNLGHDHFVQYHLHCNIREDSYYLVPYTVSKWKCSSNKNKHPVLIHTLK